MRVDDFDFHLPDNLIATTPASPRDSAKLLHINNSNLSNHTMIDLPSLLREDDILVYNNSRVIPARLYGRRGDAKVELMLHKHAGDNIWHAFAKPAKKLKEGNRVAFSNDMHAEVIEKRDGGECILAFNISGDAFFRKLEELGEMPLPPYITKQRKTDKTDDSNYQTIYAKHDGSVAAPTAGLHFTDRLFASLDTRGIKRYEVTLHVGAGTFLPVKAEDTNDHIMHSEWCSIDKETATALNNARTQGRRIVAVGTTSLRTLESLTDDKGMTHAGRCDTNLFITPGYKFKAVDALITNFHLPKSTLFMLVSAFAGAKNIKNAYQYAIDNHYRFYSYGDGCLLEREF